MSVSFRNLWTSSFPPSLPRSIGSNPIPFWIKSYSTFLDKELQQVVREAEMGRHTVDKLVKVKLQNGIEIWLLIHIEVQSQVDESFTRRMFVSNYRLFDRYGMEVISLGVLADEQADWLPQGYGYGRWGSEMR